MSSASQSFFWTLRVRKPSKTSNRSSGYDSFKCLFARQSISAGSFLKKHSSRSPYISFFRKLFFDEYLRSTIMVGSSSWIFTTSISWSWIEEAIDWAKNNWQKKTALNTPTRSAIKPAASACLVFLIPTDPK